MWSHHAAPPTPYTHTHTEILIFFKCSCDQSEIRDTHTQTKALSGISQLLNSSRTCLMVLSRRGKHRTEPPRHPNSIRLHAQIPQGSFFCPRSLSQSKLVSKSCSSPILHQNHLPPGTPSTEPVCRASLKPCILTTAGQSILTAIKCNQNTLFSL